ncbi:MAG: UDP-N-acetylglucosamine 2-epimerase [Sandaracinus sp.]
MSSSAKRRVCVVLVDRANYGRLKPVMKAIADHPALALQVVCAGTMVLERFDRPVEQLRRDGFTIDGEIYTELEGSMPVTMAKSVGFGVVEFASEFQRLRPDVVLLIGDRYEALSAALAAAYMNLTLVHMQGGEVSGSIDESARHAISKLAQYHYPATQRSAEYLVRMGERRSTILGVGCPSSDIARSIRPVLEDDVLSRRGSGRTIDPSSPFLLVVFHPTTTEFGGERAQMEALLQALERVDVQGLLLWPNIDAGSDHIAKTIRVFRDRGSARWMRTMTNLSPEAYLRVLAASACAVGNSSSFVRDAGFVGTPVVLVGGRQRHREFDIHVRPVDAIASQIEDAIRAQLAHGRYAPSTLYGDGNVSTRVADALAKLEPYVQKHLAYVDG